MVSLISVGINSIQNMGGKSNWIREEYFNNDFIRNTIFDSSYLSKTGSIQFIRAPDIDLYHLTARLLLK